MPIEISPLTDVTSYFDPSGFLGTPAALFLKLADKHIGCTSSEYEGSLGTFDTSDECFDEFEDEVLNNSNDINYVVWKGDN
eukprot:UN09585